MRKANLNIKTIGRSIKRGWNKNGQLVCAVLAGACAIGAVVEAVKAGPKAVKIRKEYEAAIKVATDDLKDGAISDEEYKKARKDANWQAAKEYAVTYGMSAALLLLSLGSTACSYKISIGKQAALLGAYKALELKQDEFMAKAKEVLGEKELSKVKNAVVSDSISKTKMPDSIKAPEYEVDKDGNYVANQYAYPCWLDDTNHPFMSSVSRIDKAMIKASAICSSQDSITLNEVYELLDPSGNELRPSTYGASHGFIAADMDKYTKLIPYHTSAIGVDGYDYSFTALIFDKRPALLDWD